MGDAGDASRNCKDQRCKQELSTSGEHMGVHTISLRTRDTIFLVFLRSGK